MRLTVFGANGQEPPTGAYRVGYVAKGSGIRAPQDDVAAFMISVVETGQHVGDMPLVNVPGRGGPG